MLKKFALWFICFGLSFLVSDVFGCTDQGRAFLYIDLGVNVIIILILVLILLFAGVVYREKLMATGISFILLLAEVAMIAIVLFATWGATKLFDVDFFVAYQIMTFGQCLCPTAQSKNNDN